MGKDSNKDLYEVSGVDLVGTRYTFAVLAANIAEARTNWKASCQNRYGGRAGDYTVHYAAKADISRSDAARCQWEAE